MSENIRISMFEIVGSPFCVASDDGEKVHKYLDAALRANQDVVLSFHKVTALTTPFLTAAVGELYRTFSEEKIRSLLKIEDAQPARYCLSWTVRRSRCQIVSQRSEKISTKHFKKSWTMMTMT